MRPLASPLQILAWPAAPAAGQIDPRTARLENEQPGWQALIAGRFPAAAGTFPAASGAGAGSPRRHLVTTWRQ